MALRLCTWRQRDRRSDCRHSASCRSRRWPCCSEYMPTASWRPTTPPTTERIHRQPSASMLHARMHARDASTQAVTRWWKTHIGWVTSYSIWCVLDLMRTWRGSFQRWDRLDVGSSVNTKLYHIETLCRTSFVLGSLKYFGQRNVSWEYSG